MRVTVVLVLALVATAAAGPKLRRISPRDVAAMQRDGKTVVFLDARGGGSDGIPGAVAVDEDDLDAWAAAADKTAIYVAYCA
jgi:hypothetical protein